ncbi:hypothetical protein K439DRAFT_1616881 [Ramaria rubella]|nr:hypothetical protein K439DRAFT_1616881 [Ramaria rubella]
MDEAVTAVLHIGSAGVLCLSDLSSNKVKGKILYDAHEKVNMIATVFDPVKKTLVIATSSHGTGLGSIKIWRQDMLQWTHSKVCLMELARFCLMAIIFTVLGLAITDPTAQGEASFAVSLLNIAISRTFHSIKHIVQSVVCDCMVIAVPMTENLNAVEAVVI